MNPRTGALFYFHSGGASGQGNPDNRKFQAKNIEMYIAGDIKAGNIGEAGMIGKIVGRPISDHHGALGIHTVWNGKLSNITANLYGRAAFLSLETWWAGKMEFDDTSGNEIKVNIQKVPDVSGTGEENTIFLIYPGTYDRIKRENPNLGATKQRGGFIGKVDADIKTDKNIVYSVLGAQGSFEIDSKGKYNITGNNNIVYSGYGYVPNWNNLIGTGTKFVVDNLQKGMTPSIKLSEPPIINGNKNIVLLFNKKIARSLRLLQVGDELLFFIEKRIHP